MQQVPNPPGDCASSDSTSSHVPRWSRIPRVQLLRNRNDQRVPFYIDQTVPVWPLQKPVRRSHSSNASPSSCSPVLAVVDGTNQDNSTGHHGYGVAKASRKFAGISQTVWFQSISEVLKTSNADAHACNVSEILRECAYGATKSNSSSKWSGIEQDLFTCTSVDPKVFVVLSAADFISNKKSKCKSLTKSQSED